MLAAFRENGAPNSSRSTSGNSSATSSAINVPSTHTSTSTGCRSSSSTGSVTVPSFLSTYSTIGIPVVIRGPLCFSAARSGFVGTILVRLFLGTVHQQPDLGTFGQESVCSWLPLRANPGETGGQNNQWHLRWAWGSPSGEHTWKKGDRSAWLVLNQLRQRGFWRNLSYILYSMVEESTFLKGNFCIYKGFMDVFSCLFTALLFSLKKVSLSKTWRSFPLF